MNDAGALESLVLVALHRSGPLAVAQVAQIVPADASELEAALARLVDSSAVILEQRGKERPARPRRGGRLGARRAARRSEWLELGRRQRGRVRRTEARHARCGHHERAPDDEVPRPDVDAMRPFGQEIWIGELWSIAPMLCDPNAPWSDTPLIVEPMGYTEPVVLLLEHGGDPSMPSGMIAFGQGELPQDPGLAPSAMGDSGSFWLCSIQIASKGGAYSLLDARREDERLTFEIVPSEIWTKHCVGDPEDCFDCASSLTCDLVRRPVALDLVIHGDTIEGSLGGTGFGTPSELRLQRMR